MNTAATPVDIQGTVAPGFEPVRELYERNMQTLDHANTQLCVYVGGERVVDLWGSAVGDPAFGPDSIVNVFSSSKNFEAIAIAWLADRGLISYDANVIEYWPEYGAGGKDQTTVADVLRHEAGLAAFGESLSAGDLTRDSIKANRVGELIERQVARYPDGRRREYHALTRGWIVNEIFRRVDPDGRTIGEFIRDELATPLNADVHLGVDDNEAGRIAPLTARKPGFFLRESLKPKRFGRQIEFNLMDAFSTVLPLLGSMTKSTSRGQPAPIREQDGILWFNSREAARAEIPSANSHCSARGLAKVAAAMAARGAWEGQRVISETAWENMHANPERSNMGMITSFTQGGVAHFAPVTGESPVLEQKLNDGRHGFYGWMGLGGSVFNWHPELDIGFAYVPTSLFVADFLNQRGKSYQAEVLRCVAAAA